MTALNLAEYCHNGECLDDILLKDLETELHQSDKDTVIVLHTIGSHAPTYNERYTKEFEKFTLTCDTNEIQKCTNEQLVNTYDNYFHTVFSMMDTPNDVSVYDKNLDILAQCKIKK